MNLIVELQQDNDKVTIRINGVLDIATRDIFTTQLDQLPEFSSLVIDFSKLEFIDSTGIGAIMELIYLSQEKKFSIHLEGMDASTQEIFEIVGLFTILETLQREAN